MYGWSRRLIPVVLDLSEDGKVGFVRPCWMNWRHSRQLHCPGLCPPIMI